MARKRFKTTGLLCTATPRQGERLRQSEISVAMFAFAEGKATEEQIQLLAKFKAALKDKRLQAKARIRRGIPTRNIIVLGEEFELTKEDLAEFKEYHERLEAIKDDKALELLTYNC